MINLDEVKNVDMSFALQYVPKRHYDLMIANNEHYKLVTYLCNLIDNKLVYDIGTYTGLSAIAMSCNKNNKVISYDIVNLLEVSKPQNVEFKIGNCYGDVDIISSALILLDVDPHDGVYEINFINWLHSNGFKGLVIADDIHLNPQMKKFWDSVTLPKLDVTNWAHWSGTGLINFQQVE